MKPLPPKIPKSTLEQWSLLDAVVECGSFALAADRLGKSQSSVSYGVARLQDSLGVALYELQGRRAVLTPLGKTLLDQARPLIRDLLSLEGRVTALSAGWESELRIALDSIFPKAALFAALQAFRGQCPHTAIEISEIILSGADEALLTGEAQLAVGNRVPVGFFGEKLLDVHFTAVAHPEHPLLQLGRALSLGDLGAHTQIVVRDSGRHNPRSDGWAGARHRWRVSTLPTALQAIRHGLGFAWLPRHDVAEDLARGTLRALPLAAGAQRSTTLYLIHADQEAAGPAQRCLAACLQAQCALLGTAPPSEPAPPRSDTP